MKTCTAATLALTLVLAFSVRAAEPTQESIEKLFVLAKVEESVNAVRSQTEQRLKAILAQMVQKTPQKNENLDQLMDRLATKVAGDMNEALKWESLKLDYVKLYRETFTQEEIDAYIAFLSSPLGKSVTEKTPGLTLKATQLSQQRLLPVIQQMQDFLKEEVEKARK